MLLDQDLRCRLPIFQRRAPPLGRCLNLSVLGYPQHEQLAGCLNEIGRVKLARYTAVFIAPSIVVIRDAFRGAAFPTSRRYAINTSHCRSFAKISSAYAFAYPCPLPPRSKSHLREDLSKWRQIRRQIASQNKLFSLPGAVYSLKFYKQLLLGAQFPSKMALNPGA